MRNELSKTRQVFVIKFYSSIDEKKFNRKAETIELFNMQEVKMILTGRSPL